MRVSVRRGWGKHNLPHGLGNNTNVHAERPMRDIVHIVAHALYNDSRVTHFAAISFGLSQTGDPGFDEMASAVRADYLSESFVVLDQMRARTTDTHIAFEDIQKLWQFVQAGA